MMKHLALPLAVCFTIAACSESVPEEIYDLDVETYSASVKTEIARLLEGKNADHPLAAQRSRLDDFGEGAAKASGTWHFKSDHTFVLEMTHPNGKPLNLTGTWTKPDAKGEYVITISASSHPTLKKDHTTVLPSRGSIVELPFFMSVFYPGDVGDPCPTFHTPFKLRTDSK